MLVIYFKFKFTWAPCILSGNSISWFWNIWERGVNSRKEGKTDQAQAMESLEYHTQEFKALYIPNSKHLIKDVLWPKSSIPLPQEWSEEQWQIVPKAKLPMSFQCLLHRTWAWLLDILFIWYKASLIKSSNYPVILSSFS